MGVVRCFICSPQREFETPTGTARGVWDEHYTQMHSRGPLAAPTVARAFTCDECDADGRRRYCAPARCYCGHPSCHAYESWRDVHGASGRV